MLTTRPFIRAAWLGSACLGLLGCDATGQGLGGCPYVLNLALLQPANLRLNIGDTLTMHVQSWAPVARECLPPDTTSAGLRWWSENGVITIDPRTAHLIAEHPGLGGIFLSQMGDSGALGQANVGVLEPLGADSVVTTIQNRFEDSARVMVQDAKGALQWSHVVGAGDSTCWVMPLSDSVRYSTVVYVPPPTGPDSASAPWTTTLAYTHTYRIVIYSYATSVPGWQPLGVSPDPGEGCQVPP